MKAQKLPCTGLVIKPVQDPIDQLKAFLIRGIVYMHEQDCPFEEEFDLNDFTSTQIIGTLAGEPVLTARIRYFGDFAKLERLAILPKYRGRGFAHLLLRFMLEFCRRKGFKKFYLHAQARLRPFYEAYGFEVMGQEFAFSDHEYLEMRADFSSTWALEHRSSTSSDPMLLNRPEGFFEVPGPIEKCYQRTEAKKAV